MEPPSHGAVHVPALARRYRGRVRRGDALGEHRALVELEAPSYQRGEDQISAIVDVATGPKFYDHDLRGRLNRQRRPDAVIERAMDAVGNVYRNADGRDREAERSRDLLDYARRIAAW